MYDDYSIDAHNPAPHAEIFPLQEWDMSEVNAALEEDALHMEHFSEEEPALAIRATTRAENHVYFVFGRDALTRSFLLCIPHFCTMFRPRQWEGQITTYARNELMHFERELKANGFHNLYLNTHSNSSGGMSYDFIAGRFLGLPCGKEMSFYLREVFTPITKMKSN